jgi:signal transduction histidine kinase
LADRPTTRPLDAHGFIRPDGPTEQEQDFLARMSHELRTPLNVIQGYADMLSEEKPEDDPDQPALAGIQRATRRLLALVESVLDLNQLRTGRFEVEPRTFALVGVVHDVVRSVADRAARNRNELVIEVPNDLRLHADLRMVRQILFNLADNAARFTHGGTVTIRATEPDDAHVAIEVVDDGIGMTPAQIAAAAQPFWQADTSTTRTYDGAGLGLAVCRGLAEAMGGSLHITSRPREGASVRVVLPRFVQGTTRWEEDEPTVLLR